MHKLAIRLVNILIFITMLALIPTIIQATELDSKLQDAVSALDEAMVKKLLQQGANPNWISEIMGMSGLPMINHIFYSSYNLEDREQKQITIARILIDNGYSLESNPQILFQTRGSYELTKFFLEKGADPNCLSGMGIPLLHRVMNDIYKDHESVANLLIDFGATPPNEETFLRLQFSQAARIGDLFKVKQLLTKGVYIDAPNVDNYTALYYSIAFLNSTQKFNRSERLNLVLFLLDSGANTNIETSGNNLLHQIAGSSTVFRTDVDEEQQKYILIIEKIIKSGVHISATSDWSKSTPLHLAARWNHLLLAKTFLKNHAKVMPRDSKGKTPLDYAESGEMIKLLKDYGATEQ